MNRIYKSIWSPTRQQYVACSEVKAVHRKTSKALVSAAVSAVLAGFAAVSLAAFVPAGVQTQSYAGDPGKIGDAASWETAEYQQDWGLAAMNASKAYALGFHGQGVNLGVMDSGALLQKHPDLAGDRFHAVHVEGVIGSTGTRYPQHADPSTGNYTQGDKFDIDGNFILGTNDSHGTHVTGTVGGNRDGSEFHGVSWGSDIYVGNTGGTDDTNYGPFLDHDFFYTGWKAITDSLENANTLAGNTGRGGVINNSFGTNIRVENNGSTGPDGGNTGVHFPTDTTAQTEYEYFLFNNVYQGKPSFVDGAWEAVKDTNVIQVFTTGNRDFANPFYRPLYPYFNPEAEKNWIAVAGMKKDGDGYTLYSTFNEAGNAKWWTVAAPGQGIYSSKVDTNTGAPSWGNSSGTSMAVPHVTGAMGVLMSRYSEMNAVQVRDVLFTTASHTNPDGTIYNGWTAGDGEVDMRYGWGMPDLEKGMYGPGQLLGTFNYAMRAGSLDIWTNSVSEVALNQRETEDKAWAAAAKKWMANPSLTLGSEYTEEEKKLLGDIQLELPDKIVGITPEQQKIRDADAIAWRKAYYQKRLDAIDSREYDGSLVKSGEGTLVMTGANTYEGNTTVEGGTLLGFTESFGKDGGSVFVNGGKLSVLKKYSDTFTQKGELTSTEATKANITVNASGTYVIAVGQDVNVGNLTLQDGSYITVGSAHTDVLKEAWKGTAQSGTVTATKLEGTAIVNPDYAFFTTDVKYDADKITGTITRDQDATFAGYASNGNGVAIGGVIDATGSGALFDALIGADKATVQKTTASLAGDFLLNVQNAAVVNTLTLTRAVKDQAEGIGSGQVAELNNGTAVLWATGVGSWGAVDYGNVDADNDFYAGLIGAEVKVHPTTKVGVFFGAGHSAFKGGDAGKIESDDLHVGLYGVSTVADKVGLTYGAAYTKQDRDGNRTLYVAGQTGHNAINNDADIAQVFVEGAYKGFNTEKYAIEPYAGLTWLHVKADDIAENVGGMTFTTDYDAQNIQVTTLGVRGSLPFAVGSVPIALKGNLAWNHFFGDTEIAANFNLAGSGIAAVKGGKLDNQFVVGLGVEAQLTKSSTFGLSYTGAYDGDLSSSGVTANLRFVF